LYSSPIGVKNALSPSGATTFIETELEPSVAIIREAEYHEKDAVPKMITSINVIIGVNHILNFLMLSLYVSLSISNNKNADLTSFREYQRFFYLVKLSQCPSILKNNPQLNNILFKCLE
jgi:hypothetical protein